MSPWEQTVYQIAYCTDESFGYSDWEKMTQYLCVTCDPNGAILPYQISH